MQTIAAKDLKPGMIILNDVTLEPSATVTDATLGGNGRYTIALKMADGRETNYPSITANLKFKVA